MKALVIPSTQEQCDLRPHYCTETEALDELACKRIDYARGGKSGGGRLMTGKCSRCRLWIIVNNSRGDVAAQRRRRRDRQRMAKMFDRLAAANERD